VNNIWKENHHKPHDLIDAVKLWPTPNARDGDPKRGATDPTSQAWANKVTRGAVNRAGMLSDDLKSAAAAWPTPQAADGERGTEWIGRREGNNPTLLGAARSFPTPRSCSGKRSSGMNRTELVNASPHAPTTPTDGAPSSSERRTLNPLFVEALMGFAPGWTDCAALATPCSHWWQRMRFALSRLG